MQQEVGRAKRLPCGALCSASITGASLGGTLAVPALAGLLWLQWRLRRSTICKGVVLGSGKMNADMDRLAFRNVSPRRTQRSMQSK